ncbi:hypothetical protein BDY24DRAFT_373205 [Mrakia frigida]|uniref:uncharacterized protein n=1 Tax=Mrakia frigida TaxID=29902 RepID=UPI003FCC203D
MLISDQPPLNEPDLPKTQTEESKTSKPPVSRPPRKTAKARAKAALAPEDRNPPAPVYTPEVKASIKKAKADFKKNSFTDEYLLRGTATSLAPSILSPHPFSSTSFFQLLSPNTPHNPLKRNTFASSNPPPVTTTAPVFIELTHRPVETLNLPKGNQTLSEELLWAKGGIEIVHERGHKVYWVREKAANGEEQGRIVVTVLTKRWADASPEELKKMGTIATGLSMLFDGSLQNCKTNSSWLKGGKEGVMVADGWRIQYSRGFGALGVYATSKVLYRYEEMVSFRSILPAFRSATYHFFKLNHPQGLLNNQLRLKQLNLASFAFPSELRRALLDPKGFASNITASYNRFGNAPHRDNDNSNFVTSGLWYTLIDGRIASFEDYQQGRLADIRGGNFYLPEYRLLINFANTAGMTFVTWNGRTDLHCTTLCVGASTHDRIGLSMQVAERMVAHSVRHEETLEEIIAGVDEEDETEEEKRASVDNFVAFVETGNNNAPALRRSARVAARSDVA